MNFFFFFPFHRSEGKISEGESLKIFLLVKAVADTKAL